MSKLFISGLVNIETTVRVRQFPIAYYPIDYPFFGVHSQVSGVAYNLSKALTTLGSEVCFAGMIGSDEAGGQVKRCLIDNQISTALIREQLEETPASVVLYDQEGRRQIYCDLKDIQESTYPFQTEMLNDCEIVVACNINYNRPLLRMAKQQKKRIATDVHVLSDLDDPYNKEFMEAADLLFLSDEKLPTEPDTFLRQLQERYHNEIIVLGQGENGAMMYVSAEDRLYDLPCVPSPHVVNTVGAGDALFACFVHYYQKGVAPLEALQYAQKFASIKIGANGAAEGFVSEAKLEES